MSRWLAMLFLTLAVLGAAGAPADRESEFKGEGLCQFALHGFVLPASSEAVINESVEKLIERHQSFLGFRREPYFRVRMRVYGRYGDFTNSPAARALPHMQGIYSPATREIVTWRQEIPGFLGTTLLHEASHAIMDAHYRNLPVWLEEGAAEYFAHSLYTRNDVTTDYLRQRWALLNRWLRDKQLPPLAPLLNATHEEWKRMNLEKAYAASWSVFQFLMSTDANRELTKKFLAERQERRRGPQDGAQQFARLYAGGLTKFEDDWHRWIDRAGPAEGRGGSFRGNGLCQFATRGCDVVPIVEAKINRQAQRLLDEHQRVFGLQKNAAFHLRVRVFGQAEEFARFAANWMVSGFDLKSTDLSRIDGYFSPLSREIVVRHSPTGDELARLVTHLANTAILREHWPNVPHWVRVGSLRCFTAEFASASAQRETLTDAWRHAGLQDKGLPDWKALLHDAAPAWSQDKAGETTPAQAIGWALFQFLSSSEPNRQVLRKLMDNLQAEGAARLGSAAQVERLYPGGWARFESDFKQWLAAQHLRV